jgi:hypothetical protein
MLIPYVLQKIANIFFIHPLNLPMVHQDPPFETWSFYLCGCSINVITSTKMELIDLPTFVWVFANLEFEVEEKVTTISTIFSIKNNIVC